MSKQTFTLKDLRRERTRQVRRDHGPGRFTVSAVQDGHELADVELTVDLEGLARRFGLRAMQSKGGRAIACHGLVKVIVLKRQRVGGVS